MTAERAFEKLALYIFNVDIKKQEERQHIF